MPSQADHMWLCRPMNITLQRLRFMRRENPWELPTKYIFSLKKKEELPQPGNSMRLSIGHDFPEGKTQASSLPSICNFPMTLERHLMKWRRNALNKVSNAVAMSSDWLLRERSRGEKQVKLLQLLEQKARNIDCMVRITPAARLESAKAKVSRHLINQFSSFLTFLGRLASPIPIL